MLKNFQKYKNTILMIAVWISLFWADFSLAQEFSYYRDEFAGPSVESIIILRILNWVLIFTGIIGLIGIVVSYILFLKDSNESKRIRILLYPLILLLLLFIIFVYIFRFNYHFG